MRFAITVCFVLVATFGMTSSAPAEDELKASTWKPLDQDDVLSRIDAWLREADVEAAIAQEVRRTWSRPIPQTERLSLLGRSMARVHPETAAVLDYCRQLEPAPGLPKFDQLQSEELPKFVRNQLRLIYGRWLARHQLYDETLEQLGNLDPAEVLEPATLLFYQCVAYHRLRRKEECLPVVRRLLEQEETIPRRFARVAQLIQADIEPLEADTLDEISRLMDSIQVRLGHGRAGTRVRKEEDDVIAKLDKMIEELEKQAQQAAAAAQAGGSPSENLQPATPMQDSVPGGGSGPGNVDPKEIGSKSGWGNLPPKEQQQALQQLGKEFPSHYRDVIEQFFRKLAKDGADQ